MELTMKEKQPVVLDNIFDPSLKRKVKIETKDVNVWYGDFQAIKGISIRLYYY